MPQAIYFNSYKLLKDADVPAFQAAANALFEAIKAEPGYTGATLYFDADQGRWADLTTWESAAAAKAFSEGGGPKELAEAFYAFLNFSTCRSNIFETA